jgi:hypothetical protein
LVALISNGISVIQALIRIVFYDDNMFRHEHIPEKNQRLVYPVYCGVLQ